MLYLHDIILAIEKHIQKVVFSSLFDVGLPRPIFFFIMCILSSSYDMVVTQHWTMGHQD